MAADGSAANRLAQAGKLIDDGLIVVFIAASGAMYVLRGEAQVVARPGFGAAISNSARDEAAADGVDVEMERGKARARGSEE
jgi:hypothetical protein